MTDNRFARRLEDLDPEERQFAAAAVEAARRSFAGFEEKPGSEYHKAPGLSAAETWAKVGEELGRVCALAALEGRRDSPLSVDDIELIHRAIFVPVFGDRTLGFRSGRADAVQFPIVVGTPESPANRMSRGSSVKKLRQNLDKALAGFEREVAELDAREAPSLADAARVAIKLYAKVIGIHPFIDGNGRTAWAVTSYALQRCDLVEIAIPPSHETRWALGQALKPGGSQSYEPLTELAVESIRRSAENDETKHD